MKRTPSLQRFFDLALDLLDAGDADRPAGAAAAREVGQGGERRRRAAAAIEQRAEGARADVLAADQPQPVETLAVAETRLDQPRGHGQPFLPILVSVPASRRAMLAAVADPQQRRQQRRRRSPRAVAPTAQAVERRGDARGQRRG